MAEELLRPFCFLSIIIADDNGRCSLNAPDNNVNSDKVFIILFVQNGIQNGYVTKHKQNKLFLQIYFLLIHLCSER